MIWKPGDRETYHRVFILVLVIVISAVFLQMIRGFIVTLLMAGIFSGLASPLYHRLLKLLRGRQATASVLTLLLLVLVVVTPLVARARVRAGRVELGDHGHQHARVLGGVAGRHHPGAAGADDDAEEMVSETGAVGGLGAFEGSAFLPFRATKQAEKRRIVIDGLPLALPAPDMHHCCESPARLDWASTSVRRLGSVSSGRRRKGAESGAHQ